MGKSELLENLRETIEQDPSYFAKAKNDKNLTTIKGVNELLDELKQEAKIKAKRAIDSAKTDIIRTPKIIDKAQRAFKKLRDSSVLKANFKYEESKTKYKDAEKLLEDAIIKAESGDYELIIKAKSIAEDAKTTVIESHRLVDSAIDIATIEEERVTNEEERAIKEENNKKEIAIKEEKRRTKVKTKNIIYTIILSPFFLIKALLVGVIGGIIGAVIGFIIGIIVSEPKTAEDISGIFLTIGLIIAALGSLISDIMEMNKE